MTRVTWNDLLYPGLADRFFAAPELPAFSAIDAPFDGKTAWWLAELSRLVYRQDSEELATPPEPRRGTFLTDVAWEQRAFFNDEEHGTQAFLVQPRSHAFTVLVFRGTDQNIRDFLCDAHVGSVLGSSSGIHAGFKRGLDCVWSRIEQALDVAQGPVFYAGHSLGGALAILAASRRRPTAVYAFGAPRVGNAAFAAGMANVPIYRIVHGDDIVATVPPELLGFTHVGQEIRIGSARTTGAFQSFDVRALWDQWLSPPKALADHAPINYVAQLHAMLAATSIDG